MHPLRSEPSDAAQGTARADRRVAIALGTCFALFYVLLGHGHFSGTDENGVFLTSAALYENMDLAIERGGNVFPGRDGRHYSIFAVGQSVLALPFYALGDVAERVISPAWQSRLFGRGRSEPETAKTFAVGLFAPVASAVLIALFFLMERRLGVTLRSAAISAALLGGTTYVAAMSGRTGPLAGRG